MMDAVLLLCVVGAVVLALGLDVAALVAFAGAMAMTKICLCDLCGEN